MRKIILAKKSGMQSTAQSVSKNELNESLQFRLTKI